MSTLWSSLLSRHAAEELARLSVAHNSTLIIMLIYQQLTQSRHTVVCRAAQEVGAPHREYINRKKENAIFTPI